MRYVQETSHHLREKYSKYDEVREAEDTSEDVNIMFCTASRCYACA
jgi:hypothetical protein